MNQLTKTEQQPVMVSLRTPDNCNLPVKRNLKRFKPYTIRAMQTISYVLMNLRTNPKVTSNRAGRHRLHQAQFTRPRNARNGLAERTQPGKLN